MFRTLCFAFVILSLSACAPAVNCIEDTAFSATVMTFDQVQTLRVQPEQAALSRPLNVSASAETRVISGRGEALTLGDLTAGAHIYVRGDLMGSSVTASEIRLLNE